MRVLAQRERNEAAFTVEASLVATRHDRNRSRTISFNRWCAARSLISNTNPPARASGRLLTAGRIAVFNAPLASMPSTTPRNKLRQPSSRSCGVARHDLAPTAFVGVTIFGLAPRAARPRRTSPPDHAAHHRPPPSCPRAGRAGAWRAPARGGQRPSTRAAPRRTFAGATASPPKPAFGGKTWGDWKGVGGSRRRRFRARGRRARGGRAPIRARARAPRACARRRRRGRRGVGGALRAPGRRAGCRRRAP